jgi:hypothetical protein
MKHASSLSSLKSKRHPLLNLKTLIKQAVVKIQESGEKEHMFVGKRVRYRFNKECDGKTETAWYSGKIVSQDVSEYPLYMLLVFLFFLA